MVQIFSIIGGLVSSLCPLPGVEALTQANWAPAEKSVELVPVRPRLGHGKWQVQKIMQVWFRLSRGLPSDLDLTEGRPMTF